MATGAGRGETGDGGWLPRWALGPSETNVMSGEGPTPFITSLYARGLLDKPTARALFEALWKNVTEVPADPSVFRGRDGNPTYVRNGWIGYQDKGGYVWGDSRQAGSATLEYALADCGLADMARGLGESAKAAALRERCGNFANEWDFGVGSKGLRAAVGLPPGVTCESSSRPPLRCPWPRWR
ncbi:glycoside hydrolase family 92 protein [Streptomyces sp. NBC_00873]|uniref:glycoside hydrolase domain-containing protein n=1 Tax=unclassified Streptomyces TaxID=2593676 RepID=UPI0038695869|nr:glycoside hydrolase family 92 protein [Streptomyces sp. NBC_00873]WSY97397.1 glycoside hydrolase family 92 protein [Streptomyces sp. NBC_00873]WTA48608.1 glycoside hydrolase family 92 protein [Streptomyces sp. NBC_00842]WTA49066.1 glycoside hydrolase family 92 protein [Streptomyces sp. NBC_00842]